MNFTKLRQYIEEEQLSIGSCSPRIEGGHCDYSLQAEIEWHDSRRGVGDKSSFRITSVGSGTEGSSTQGAWTLHSGLRLMYVGESSKHAQHAQR